MLPWNGAYLRVDVSAGGSARTVPIAPDELRRFIGGVGLGARLLHAECPTGVEPLAPESPLIFAFSPLVGGPLTTSAKFAVVCKSPLTQRISDSLCSSHFAIAAKRAGMDALVVVGAAAGPSALVIDDGAASLRPSADLWGLSADAAAERLRAELGPEFRVAAIGPAGENLVRYATVSHDGRHAGRGGAGAIMGAKRIKAIALRGRGRGEQPPTPELIALARDLARRAVGPATEKYRELGTVANLLTFHRLALLPTRNFQQNTFESAEAIGGERLGSAFGQVRESCAACNVGCEHRFTLPGGQSVRMEYENLFALGPLCGIGDAEAILRASQLCDRLGLDTISAGATIAFAMECAERGLIDEPDLRFGRADALMRTLEDIAARRGLGDLLAEGSRIAAERIGGGAAAFAPHVKGLEIPGYEPRAMQAMALGFAVGTRGADHNRSGAYEADLSERVDRLVGSEESALAAVDTEDRAAIMDSLILCKFLRRALADLYAEGATMLRLTTGLDFSADELRAAARRIVDCRKAFNVREGWTPAEDTLPERFLSEALPDGVGAGATLPRARLAAMVRSYNLARGWSAEGWPGAEAASEMGTVR